MKRLGLLFGIALVLVTLPITVVMAKPGGGPMHGSQGWGPGGDYHRMYDPATVVSVSGEVIAYEQFSPAKGMGNGVHLKLKTDAGEIDIHLGPSWYIENQDIQFSIKDKITVKGSKVTFENKPAIIAAEVTKGDQVLKLRDDNGFPVWAGWRNK